MSDKVGDRHIRRKAIVYVRQSTLQQVLHNEESRRLQYAMQDRLRSLGWKRVDVIDDDLGRSAGGLVERAGFQRLVAEVSLGEVGAVAARELSRFARNSRDWQKLIEVCRYVDTVLVDQDSVYDARLGNDRLLLGLKGSLNEYELDLLRLRGLEARREKALRGDYLAKVAVGYRKNDDGRLELTPDLRVQQAIRLVFDKVLELGSARQCLLWLREQGLEVPVNRNHRGVVLWKPPRAGWLYQVLTNPVYAGAYAYGRTSTKTTFYEGEARQRVERRPRGEWLALLRDHHEAYIDWERFERIQEMLSKNSQRRRSSSGAPKAGLALLAGVLRCRRCGQKLIVSYSGASGRIHRYECERMHTDHGDNRCIGFSGIEVDERMSWAVLTVVRPGAIEASLRAATDDAGARNEIAEALRLEQKAAAYASERAFRQFDAVDPENRLVADELERRWNDALERLREVEDRIGDEDARARQLGEPPDAETFLALGETFSRVWDDPATDARLRKRIVRTLVEEIIVDVDESSNEIVLVVHWKGGVHIELRVPRRRRGHNRAQTPPDVVDAVRQLALVCSDEEIAAWLNKAAIATAQGNPWSRSVVAALRHSRQIPVYSEERQESEGWITLDNAASLVGVASLTLKRAIARGVFSASQPVPRGPWILRREELFDPERRDRILKKPRPSSRAATAAQRSSQLTLGIPRR